MKHNHYHVAIVGSGPSAFGVAESLKSTPKLAERTIILEKGRPLEDRVCAVKEGKKCRNCSPCNIIYGLGGAGPFTDGKICLFKQDLPEIFKKVESIENDTVTTVDERIDKYLDRCCEIWKRHGVSDYKETKINDALQELKANALKNDIDFEVYPVLHIGSDGAFRAINNMVKEIEDAGIEIKTNTEVGRIRIVDDLFEITVKQNDVNTSDCQSITCDFLVLGLGRAAQKAFDVADLLKELEVTFEPKNLEIGFRVEIPYQIMKEIGNVTFDPKFRVITKTYEDQVRTFCTCPRGKVVREGNYINGHVDKNRLTENTNFALLARWSLAALTFEDAMDYGDKIAKLVLAYGKGKPLIQRLGDLRRGVASTKESIKKSHIKPSLWLNRHVEPGDIASCYPRRIIVDLLEGFEKLNTVIQGVSGDQTLLYAPEIKPTCAVRYNNGVKTAVDKLYICGDFSGYSRGIAQAMCMGMIIGEEIVRGTNGLQLRFI